MSSLLARITSKNHPQLSILVVLMLTTSSINSNSRSNIIIQIRNIFIKIVFYFVSLFRLDILVYMWNEVGIYYKMVWDSDLSNADITSIYQYLLLVVLEY